MRRTRIVCTLGPASSTEDVLRQMLHAGMDVARINMSHGDQATHARNIGLARRLAAEEGQNLAILLDLQGPRLRVGELQSGQATLRPGADYTLTTRLVPGDDRQVTVSYPELPADVRPGDRILLDDGLLELQVTATTATDVHCQVVTGGLLKPHKGLNLPGLSLSTPSLTDKDVADVAFAVAQGVDYIALSFVRRAADVQALKDLLKSLGAAIPIIAKIEKRQAVDDFAAILQIADGAMVARGDLAIETHLEDVPIFQKSLIKQCNAAGKPVITATQMLQSMIDNPRPTRAEASDVANAILDGSDAVMLSGETAVGSYPVPTVQTMARLAAVTEQALPYREWMNQAALAVACGTTEAISQATCEIAYELGARAIITATASGYTARMVARHRPSTPLIAVTANPVTQRRLALVWGVHALVVPQFRGTDEMMTSSVNAAVQAGIVKEGDIVLLTAGVPVGEAGRTNLLKVHVVGEMGI
jgi:pyruvate kinase